MITLVLTVLGNDQSGLVNALSEVVSRHEGNWVRSEMARLAGKFAGIVMITVPEESADALIADLQPLEASGLLVITVERVSAVAEDADAVVIVMLEVVGQDQPGIVRDISTVLVAKGVSIDELGTDISSAPMSGERLFHADAVLSLPAGLAIDDLQTALDEVADRLMVEIELHLE